MCNPLPKKRCANHASKTLQQAREAANELLRVGDPGDTESIRAAAEALTRAQRAYDATERGIYELAAESTSARRAWQQAGSVPGSDEEERYNAILRRQHLAHVLDDATAEQNACMPAPGTYDAQDKRQRQAYQQLAKARYEHALVQTDVTARYLDGEARTTEGRAALVAAYRSSLEAVRSSDLAFRAAANEHQDEEYRQAAARYLESLASSGKLRASEAPESSPSRAALVAMTRTLSEPGLSDDVREPALRNLRELSSQNGDPALTRPFGDEGTITHPAGWQASTRSVSSHDWALATHLASTSEHAADVEWSGQSGALVARDVSKLGVRQLWRAGFFTEEKDDGSLVISRVADLRQWDFKKKR